MTFAEKLARLRKREGLSQEELAGKLGVSRQAISRWEMGTAMPDSPNLLKLSRLFRVSADYLLYDEYEEDLRAAAETAPVKRGQGAVLAGGIILGASLLGLFVLVLFPAASRAFGHEYSSMKTFLRINDLEWLFILLMVTAAAGTALVCFPWLRGLWRDRKEKKRR